MPRVHPRVTRIRSHGYLHGKMKNSDPYKFIPTDDLDPQAQILKPGSVGYPWEQICVQLQYSAKLISNFDSVTKFQPIISKSPINRPSVMHLGPFVPAISNTTLSLITTVQNAKKNQDECMKLMENVSGILYAIVNLHLKSEPVGSLLPTTLNHVGNFTGRAQQEGNKIRDFFLPEQDDHTPQAPVRWVS
ncbi:hypothetical protein C8R44DRAFT_744197 [Mycena epipterygia]|nr:hypothetical protein C8R44DRAFT_744197 [Mycena epipterygia]